MSQDRPTAPQLLAAVRALLEDELLPEASGARAFKLRVAANVLSIVERELRLGTGLETQERVRLAELLGHDADLASLEAEFAARIRNGSLDLEHEAVLACARMLTNHKLQIANPSYR